MGWLDKLSLIIPSCSHVDDRANSLFDSIPWRASFSFDQNLLPVCNSCTLSAVNLSPLSPRENRENNHLSQEPVVGMYRAIYLCLQSSPPSGVLPSNTVPGYTFWATHLEQARTQATLVCSCKSHCAKSRYKEKGCIWISSGAMLFSETRPNVIDCLPVTLLSFTRVSCPVDHSSATILLPNCSTSSHSSSAHSSC